MTLEAAVEAVLPELGEPRVPGVVLRPQLQVVVVEPLDVGRLELDGDAACCFPHVAVGHVVAVGPAVTATTSVSMNEPLWKTWFFSAPRFGGLCESEQIKTEGEHNVTDSKTFRTTKIGLLHLIGCSPLV